MRLHLHAEVAGRRVLVVGAGPAGTEKVHRLVSAGALVTVVDPAPLVQDLAEVADVHEREFRPEDVQGRWLVVAAAGSEEVNEAVAAAASVAGVWVNRVDQADGGDVTFGAVVRRGRVEVGVTTGGASPSLARWVQNRIDAVLPPQLASLAELLAQRPRVDGRRRHGAIPLDAAIDALARGDEASARRLINGG